MRMVAGDPYGQTFDVDPTQLEWRPSVYVVVIKDNKILLSPQFLNHGYDLPGGGVDIDETLEEAALRECKEETGLEVKLGRHIGFGENLFRSSHLKKPKIFHSHMHFYEAFYMGGEVSTDNFDENEKLYAGIAEWVEITKIKNLNVASSFDWRPIVLKYLEQRNGN